MRHTTPNPFSVTCPSWPLPTHSPRRAFPGRFTPLRLAEPTPMHPCRCDYHTLADSCRNNATYQFALLLSFSLRQSHLRFPMPLRLAKTPRNLPCRNRLTAIYPSSPAPADSARQSRANQSSTPRRSSQRLSFSTRLALPPLNYATCSISSCRSHATRRNRTILFYPARHTLPRLAAPKTVQSSNPTGGK